MSSDETGDPRATASHDGPGTDPGADPPEMVVRPDVRSLRALTHPLRLRLLGLLRSDGPATASQLAARTGQNSGATSYHLRQLAEHGFIVEAADRGNARDRWWRAAHRSTHFELPPDADEESKALGEQYLRVVGDAYSRRLDAAIAALPTLEEDLGPGWHEGFTMSDMPLRLTAAEAQALVAELDAVAERYRSDDPDRRAEAPAGAQRVFLQYQVLPLGADSAAGTDAADTTTGEPS
jgi:DNA-binding transcriptional ArsR family regulator